MNLSKRQLQVALLAADGLTNKEIARALKLAPETVKTHMHHILDRTKLSRSELWKCLGGPELILENTELRKKITFLEGLLKNETHTGRATQSH